LHLDAFSALIPLMTTKHMTVVSFALALQTLPLFARAGGELDESTVKTAVADIQHKLAVFNRPAATEPVDVSEVLEPSCLVSYYSDSQMTKYMGSCSATLFSPDKLLTAAHCETETKKMLNGEVPHTTAHCPHETRGQTRVVVSRKTHPTYAEENTGMTQFDLAVLRVGEPFGIRPARTPGKRYFQKIVDYSARDQRRCLAVGFAGRRANPTVFFVNVKFKSGWVLNFIIDPFPLRPGDSGGGMFCQNPSGNWYLMGVNSYTAAHN
jgi:hypothetical protein